MSIYISMSLLSLIFSMLFDYSKDKDRYAVWLRRVVFVLASMPIILVAGLRYDVGTDYINIYWNYFLALLGGGDKVSGTTVELDIGLYFFVKVLQIFTNKPESFFFVSSIIIYFAITSYIRKSEKMISVSLMLFVTSGLFFTSLNVVRQFFALSIVLFGFGLAKKRKFIKYLLICIIAACFHLSALLLVPLYFFFSIEINRKKIVFVLCVFVASMPVVRFIFEQLILHTRYKYYLTSKLYVVDYDLAGTIYALMITTLFLLLYKNIKKGPQFNFCTLNLLAYDCIIIMSYFIPLANRISLFFKFFVFVNMVPMLFEAIPQKGKRRIIQAATYIILIGLTLYLYFYRGNSDVFPYISIWERGV